MIKKYRQKQTAEVIEWTGENLDEAKAFLGDCFISRRVDNSIEFKSYPEHEHNQCCDFDSFIIRTLDDNNQYYYSCCIKDFFLKHNELVEDSEIIKTEKMKQLIQWADKHYDINISIKRVK